MRHESGAFDTSPEEVYGASFNESEDRLFKLLQREVIRAELAHHPDMSETDWIIAYSAPYRALIAQDKELLERYRLAVSDGEKKELLSEIRRRLAQ